PTLGADVYEVAPSTAQGVRLASRRVYASGGRGATTVAATINGLTPRPTHPFEGGALRRARAPPAAEGARPPPGSICTPPPPASIARPLPVVPTPTPFTTPGPERTRPNAP